ncbi:MAG: nitroreductase family deazaflavin-dependent oxidoreductase [Mycobacteriaceae bacterium]|nr:nitroreductase family deazaflavin-dependent oxidoreductase [Mycobacteriaceae bacterium]
MSNNLANSIAARAAGIASFLGPRVMRVIAQFNKRVTNRAAMGLASRLPYMAIIEHDGRKSGSKYKTPIMAFIAGGELSVVLNYGTESDWVRNLQAAGSAGVVHRGKRYWLTDPRVIPLDSQNLPPAVRGIRASARSALHGNLSPS